MRLDIWTFVRFAHVLAAITWVGGQLTLSVVVRPVLTRDLSAADVRSLLSGVGRRYAVIANAFVLPALLVTGVALMVHRNVDAQTLTATDYGHTLIAKLALFAVVIGLAAGHGIAAARGQLRVSRSLATASLLGSVVIVYLATSLIA